MVNDFSSNLSKITGSRVDQSFWRNIPISLPGDGVPNVDRVINKIPCYKSQSGRHEIEYVAEECQADIYLRLQKIGLRVKVMAAGLVVLTFRSQQPD